MPASIKLPASDSALQSVALNFKTKITASPTTYGLTAAQATANGTAYTNFANALALCNKTVRIPANTSAKNDCRDILKNSIRSLALIVAGTPTVTDAQKLELGMTIQAPPSDVPAPSVAPSLDIVKITGRTVQIRLHDATGEGKRSKPPQVKSAAICSYVGATPPSDPSAYKWEGSSGKQIVDVTFPESVEPGSQVFLTAMWLNEKQEPGPACEPQGAIIGYGMSAAI